MSGNKLFLLVFLTALVFAGLFSYGDFQRVGQQLAGFPVTHLLGALALAALNYLLRFFRWAYYLRVLRLKVPLGLSGLVFLSGLAMSVTPGKMGELLKSYLLRDRAGSPVAATAPVVVMERLTDLLSVVLLGLVGLALLPLAVILVLTVCLLLGGSGLWLMTSRHSERLLGLPLLRRWESAIRASREGLRVLARPRTVLVAVALGTLAWLSEGVALWLILRGLGAELDLSRALPIYAAATLVGAATTLPGGLVGTEGSLIALLQRAGLAKTAASAGTLLVRLATLWFAVVIGLVALACLRWFQPAQASSRADASPSGSVLLSPPE